MTGMFEEFDKENVKDPVPVSRILRDYTIQWNGDDGLMDLILRINPNQLIPSEDSVVSFEDYEVICAVLENDGMLPRRKK